MFGVRALFRRSLLARACLILALAVGSSACDLQTATAPAGDLTLYATFDDVQDLTTGHYVQMSDVVVGSVGDLQLDGHRARVRLDVDGDREVPVGARAVIRRTSLLGEHYVDLVLPEGFAPGKGDAHVDEDEIADTASQLELEELAARAGEIIGAVDARPLSQTLDAADRAIGGRGETLNVAVAKTGDVVGALQAQEAALARTIDAMAALGARFAPEAGRIGDLLDSMAAASDSVAESRDRAVVAGTALVSAVESTNDNVLRPHTETIIQLLADADPVIAAVASRSSALQDLFVDIDFFNNVFPDVQANGQVLIQAWLDPLVLLGGSDNLDVTDPVAIITALLNGLL